MAIIIDPNADLVLDTPSFAIGPEGASLIKAYAYPNYFSLQDAEIVNTYQADFYGATLLGFNPWHNLFTDTFNGIYEKAWANGEEVLAYFVYQKPVVEISVPDQFCFLDNCWTPPFAGQDIVSGYQYRLWVLTKDIVYGPFPKAVRGFIPWALAVVIVGAIVILLPQILSFVGVVAGQLPWSTLKDPENSPVDRWLDKPGDAIQRAEVGLAIPLLFLGGGMAGFAFILANMGRKSISVTQPTPAGGRVTVAGGTK